MQAPHVQKQRAEEPARPRPSATVVLAREGQGSPEFFLVHRHARASFGASYVFPGGLVDPGDCEAEAFSRAFPAEAANRCLGLAAGGLDYYCAAIRELFEETGVLLARDAEGAMVTGAFIGASDLEAARDALNKGRLRWPDFLRERELTLAADALHYFAWWITPRARPKRFSTRFFLAALPEGQVAAHDGRELTDSRWAKAAEALAAHDEGELVLPPPTRATLVDLAGCATLDGLLEWAGRRCEAGVPRILPVIVSSGGRERILMPGDPDYPGDAGREEP
jgi:8-oxo-dGTP pyrophosphatase MutT (NUDIX family)